MLPSADHIARSKPQLAVAIIRGNRFISPLPEGQPLAKRAKKSSVFLIIDDTGQRTQLAAGLRYAGFDVHD